MQLALASTGSSATYKTQLSRTPIGKLHLRLKCETRSELNHRKRVLRIDGDFRRSGPNRPVENRRRAPLAGVRGSSYSSVVYGRLASTNRRSPLCSCGRGLVTEESINPTMMSQLLRIRVVLPKIRSCLILGTERCSKTSSVLSRCRIPARSYMNKTSNKMETKLRERDMVPEGFNLIYRGGMDYYIHMAYSTSTIMMILGVTHIATVMFKTDVVYFPLPLADSIIGLKNYTQFMIMYAAFFLMLFTTRYISVRYVLRMYYNPDTKTYLAIKVGYLPMAISTHEFKAGTLNRVPKRYALRIWKNIEYKYRKGDTLMLFEHGFKTSADYDRMFVLGTNDIPNENEDQNIPKYQSKY